MPLAPRKKVGGGPIATLPLHGRATPQAQNPGLKAMEHERGPHWYEVIGAFIINFGAVETCSYQWILELGGQTVLNNNIGPLLGQRIKLLLELISKSSLSPEQKKHFSALWIEISELAKTRNVIA